MASGRLLQHLLNIRWDGVTATDESDKLVRANGSFSFGAPNEYLLGGNGIVDSAAFTLRADSARTPAVVNGSVLGAIVEFSVIIDGGAAERVFTGVVQAVDFQPVANEDSGELRLRCTTIDGDTLQAKVSTPLSTFQYYASAGANEEQYIRHLLTEAGLSGVPRHFDNGLVALNWLWADDESALEEIWQVCAATGGRFYVDRFGAFVYENATKIAQPTASAETLTRSSYRAASVGVSTSGIYSGVTVEASPRRVGGSEVLWTPDDEEDLTIAAGKDRTITARFAKPVLRIDKLEYTVTNAGGLDITAMNYLTLHARKDYAQHVVLTYRNKSTMPCYLRDVKISGVFVHGAPTVENTADASGAAFWTSRSKRNRSVRGNPYVQSTEQAGFLAQQLLAVEDSPLTRIELKGCVGKASRVCGQRVTISDTGLFPANVVALVYSVTWRYEKTFEQDLTAYMADELYADAPYFVVGVDRLSAGKKMFY